MLYILFDNIMKFFKGVSLSLGCYVILKLTYPLVKNVHHSYYLKPYILSSNCKPNLILEAILETLVGYLIKVFQFVFRLSK